MISTNHKFCSKGATAGLSSSAALARSAHCWTSQQWHPIYLLSVIFGLLFVLPVRAADPVSVNTPSAEPFADKLTRPSVDGKPPYEPQGATATPKVDVQWDRYHDYTAATLLLQQLAKAYPDRARLVSLGKSYGNRQMWVLTITNFKTASASDPAKAIADTDKPAFWIDGGIHANEIQASEVVLYTSWYLLEMYDHSPMVRRLVDERTFYLMPMMSPDSRDAHFYEPNSTHSPRAGQRPIGDARDGATGDGAIGDDDPRDDLDHDGSITEMRIRDPNGRSKPDPDFPQRMIPARPDEKGSYTLLGSESFNRPGEGKLYRVRRGYYDPNRDWAWHWGPYYVQSGAYRYPFSILENRMVADFILAHRNIAGAQSYHNAGGMILRGPGVKEDHYESADVALFDVLGRRGEQMLPGYRYITAGADLYECYGAELDWLYVMRGIFGFTNELFPAFNFNRQKSDGSFGGEAVLHQFDRDILLGDGIVPWHAVEHPIYGKIEVGGFKKNWVRQPPSFLLEEECHRNMAFTFYHADQMPLVKVQSIDVKSLDGGLNQVTAVISNERMLPTHAAIDVLHQITPPDLVTITGPHVNVFVGLTAPDQFFEEATEQKRHPSTLRLKTIPSMGAAYVRWIVSGAGPYAVRVQSYKGGIDEKKTP